MTMRFEARDLKPSIETMPPDQLVEGELYFSVGYVDDEMVKPILLSLVFIGRDLKPGDKDACYFQDLESHAAGVRYVTASEEAPATFQTGDIVKSIQRYDQALDELLRCSLRRSRTAV